MGLFTFLGDVLTGGAYTANKTNQNIANQNLQYQREANAQNIAFQKEENDITRMREDNAVHRAALDMQAAGLSKTLAAGNPASAQQLTSASVSPLHNDYKAQKLDFVGGLLNLKSQYENIKNQIAQTNFVNEQAKGQQIANSFDFENNKNMLKLNALKIDASIADTRAKNASARLDEIKGEHYGSYLKAEINKLIYDTDYTGEQIAYIIAQREHLSKDTEKLIEEIAIAQHNLKYAQSRALPVGIIPNGFIGSVINGVSSGSNAFGNWYGNAMVNSWRNYLDSLPLLSNSGVRAW